MAYAGQDYDDGYKLDRAHQAIADLKREAADLRARAEAAEAKIAAIRKLADLWQHENEQYSRTLRAGESRLPTYQHQLLITGCLRADALREALTAPTQVGEESGGDAEPGPTPAETGETP